MASKKGGKEEEGSLVAFSRQEQADLNSSRAFPPVRFTTYYNIYIYIIVCFCFVLHKHIDLIHRLNNTSFIHGHEHITEIGLFLGEWRGSFRCTTAVRRRRLDRRFDDTEAHGAAVPGVPLVRLRHAAGVAGADAVGGLRAGRDWKMQSWKISRCRVLTWNNLECRPKRTKRDRWNSCELLPISAVCVLLKLQKQYTGYVKDMLKRRASPVYFTNVETLGMIAEVLLKCGGAIGCVEQCDSCFSQRV